MSDILTRTEKRCLRLSYEVNKGMPQFPETICISFRVSRYETIENLCRKGFLTWSPHRGSTYTFTEKARAFVGTPVRVLHFVGFKDDRYWNAVRVFGKPDFIHRRWDARAVCEVCPGDVVVFATGDEWSPVDPYAYDDSAYF